MRICDKYPVSYILFRVLLFFSRFSVSLSSLFSFCRRIYWCYILSFRGREVLDQAFEMCTFLCYVAALGLEFKGKTSTRSIW